MILFKIRLGAEGPNLLAAALYPRRGWLNLFLFPLTMPAVPLWLPLPARWFK